MKQIKIVFKLPSKSLYMFYALLLVLPIELCHADNLTIDVPYSCGIGKPFLVKISSKSKFDRLLIKWDNKVIEPSIRRKNEYFEAMAILGIGLKLKQGKYPIRFEISQSDKIQKIDKAIEIVDVSYNQQKLSVKPNLVVLPEKIKSRVSVERRALLEAINTISPKRYWELPFFPPVKGKMLSRFGLHRVFNEETKSRHTGLDFRAWEGTPIHTVAEGKILLVGTYYFPGNFVMVDHGNGVVSFYCHMSKITVKKGEHVVSGQQIGLSGSTGRTTGAHLHLSMYANGRVIDPEPFFNSTIDSHEQWTGNGIN